MNILGAAVRRDGKRSDSGDERKLSLARSAGEKRAIIIVVATNDPGAQSKFQLPRERRTTEWFKAGRKRCYTARSGALISRPLDLEQSGPGRRQIGREGEGPGGRGEAGGESIEIDSVVG